MASSKQARGFRLKWTPYGHQATGRIGYRARCGEGELTVCPVGRTGYHVYGPDNGVIGTRKTAADAIRCAEEAYPVVRRKNPPRAYAHLGYSRDWKPRYKPGDTVWKTLHVGPIDVPVRGKVTVIRPMGSGRLGSSSYEPHYDVQWSRIGRMYEKALLKESLKRGPVAWVHPDILEPGLEERVPEGRLRRKA